MSSTYPSTLDVLTNPTANDVLTGHASQHINANDCIEAIEATLGTNPQGGSSTVKARLDALDATVAAIEGVPEGSAVAPTIQVVGPASASLAAATTIVHAYQVNSTPGGITLTIPAGSAEGRTIFVFDKDQNIAPTRPLTITATGKLINGAASVALSEAKQGAILTCDSDGNWMCVLMSGA